MLRRGIKERLLASLAARTGPSWAKQAHFLRMETEAANRTMLRRVAEFRAECRLLSPLASPRALRERLRARNYLLTSEYAQTGWLIDWTGVDPDVKEFARRFRQLAAKDGIPVFCRRVDGFFVEIEHCLFHGRMGFSDMQVLESIGETIPHDTRSVNDPGKRLRAVRVGSWELGRWEVHPCAFPLRPCGLCGVSHGRDDSCSSDARLNVNVCSHSTSEGAHLS